MEKLHHFQVLAPSHPQNPALRTRLPRTFLFLLIFLNFTMPWNYTATIHADIPILPSKTDPSRASNFITSSQLYYRRLFKSVSHFISSHLQSSALSFWFWIVKIYSNFTMPSNHTAIIRADIPILSSETDSSRASKFFRTILELCVNDSCDIISVLAASFATGAELGWRGHKSWEKNILCRYNYGRIKIATSYD